MTFHPYRLIPFLLVLPTAAMGAGVIVSDFETGLDGWVKAAGSDAGSSLVWVTTGGNPGGFLRVNEAAQGAVDRISAPAAFVGDKSAFVGGTFQVDRQTNILTNISTSNDDIRLVSDSMVLRYDLPSPGLNEWVTATVDLRAAAGWVKVSNNQAPTDAEFLAVMSNLTAIQLLADFRSGTETPSFDNIIMTIPEPSAALVFLSFALCGCWVRRRR